MDQNKTDLVMKFVLDGQPVWAECTLDVAPGDTLMKEFLKNTTYDCYSNFFEVSTFNMGMSLKEGDESTNTINQPQRQNGLQPKNPTTGQYASWRNASQSEYKSIYFPLEFDKFSFERIIDSASPIFFECCCTSKTFDSATLVKRLSQGDVGGVYRPSLAYLKIEFTKVLITGINWDDGDLVKEQCEFICQGMTVTYRRQTADGTIGGGDVGAFWPNPKKDRSLNIRGGGRGN